jgi:hypothetical protein
MGLRFRRSVRLMPGVRLNFGMRGMSVSTGVRGASVTFGSRGIYANSGIPGTGLSYRQRLDNPASRRRSASSSQSTSLPMQLVLHDDGTVKFLTEDGAEASPKLVKMAREQQGERLTEWLQSAVDNLNADYQSCVDIHLGTPNPFVPRFRQLDAFSEPKPVPPTPRAVSWFDRLLGRRAQIEADNVHAERVHGEAVTAWEQRRDEHEAAAADWLALLGRLERGETDAMETLFTAALQQIVWPKETLIDFDLSADGKSLQLDIDLPDEDDIPRRIATVAGRGFKVTFKDRSDAQVRRDFGRLAHGTLFRVIGEAFATLGTVNTVTASAYVQRPDPATGSIRDEYILSVRVARDAWQRIDFDRLGDVDPAAALENFELVRSAERGGRLRSIEPLSIGNY